MGYPEGNKNRVEDGASVMNTELSLPLEHSESMRDAILAVGGHECQVVKALRHTLPSFPHGNQKSTPLVCNRRRR